MRKNIITKILLSRKLYQLSLENLNSDNELSLSIGVILLQDSVEIFLLAVAEHIDASIGNNSNFNQYFDLINKKLSPKELPFKLRLTALNKLRVNAKHYGLSLNWYSHSGHLEKSAIENKLIEVRDDHRKKELLTAI